MAEFVEVAHKDIKPTALVPKSALARYYKDWVPVAEVETPPSAAATEGEPSLKWTRSALDEYAAKRFSLDTTAEENKAAVLAAIQGIHAAQGDSSPLPTTDPGVGADKKES